MSFSYCMSRWYFYSSISFASYYVANMYRFADEVASTTHHPCKMSSQSLSYQHRNMLFPTIIYHIHLLSIYSMPSSEFSWTPLLLQCLECYAMQLCHRNMYTSAVSLLAAWKLAASTQVLVLFSSSAACAHDREDTSNINIYISCNYWEVWVVCTDQSIFWWWAEKNR